MMIIMSYHVCGGAAATCGCGDDDNDFDDCDPGGPDGSLAYSKAILITRGIAGLTAYKLQMVFPALVETRVA